MYKLDSYVWNTFPVFNTDKNEFRKAYNRLIISRNISESLGLDAVEDYLKQFTEADKGKMLIMGAFIKKNGVDEAIKTINASDD